MLKVSTAKEMQRIDRSTIEKYGLAGIVLMERAGLAVVKKANELFPPSKYKTIVLCGAGNNGGDGLVIARLLHDQGSDVEAYLAGSPAKLKGDAKTNYLAAKKFGVNIFPINKFLKPIAHRLSPNVLIIDALLGTGLNNDVRPPLADVIKKVNRMSAHVVAVDVSSGISSDTGQVMGSAIKADCTVTFGLPKRGHLLYPGAEYTGKLFVEEIGFPKELLESEKINVNLFEKGGARSLLPKRKKNSHKGTYGHVLLVAGSKGKTGAALMAAKACLRSGAGLVTIAMPESLVSSFQSRVTEEMILPLPDRGNGTLSSEAAGPVLQFLESRGNVLAIGPGLSVDDEIKKLAALLISGSKVPVIIDADGLNAIEGRTSILKKSRVPLILTPHPGEMDRLLGPGARGKRQGGEEDRISMAVTFAKKTKTYLVLKGAPTVIAAPDGRVFINSSGNPGMATAGTGDVLTGMISAFSAQGLTPLDAALLGVYMHGQAGDTAAGKKGGHSLIASDIIKEIPGIFRDL